MEREQKCVQLVLALDELSVVDAIEQPCSCCASTKAEKELERSEGKERRRRLRMEEVIDERRLSLLMEVPKRS